MTAPVFTANAPEAKGQILTFKIRAYPKRQQHVRFADYLQHTRQLYNAALEERIGCYQKTGRTISNAEQSRGLTELRKACQRALMRR